MSDRPFALRVHYSARALHRPRLASVHVEWDGESFVIERFNDPGNLKAGYTDIHFTDEQSLPGAASTFRVSLFNEAGHGAEFPITCAVLPTNPFDLGLGPDGDFVTGTWSTRGIRHGDAYDTGVAAQPGRTLRAHNELRRIPKSARGLMDVLSPREGLVWSAIWGMSVQDRHSLRGGLQRCRQT